MTARDIKSALLAIFALQSTSVTAGGSGDATEIVGSTINLQTLAKRPASVVFDIPVRAVLAAGKKITVVGRIQESIDGTTWTNATGNDATLLTLLDSGSGSTMTGIARIGLDVIRKNCNYVRVRCTPDMDAANTDTAVVGAGTANFSGLASDPGN